MLKPYMYTTRTTDKNKEGPEWEKNEVLQWKILVLWQGQVQRKDARPWA